MERERKRGRWLPVGIVLIVLLLVILVPAALLFLGFASDNYPSDSLVTDGAYTVACGYYRGIHFRNRAGVFVYEWDGDPEHRTITIPDEWNGKKVRTLGGFFGKGVPYPFTISFLPTEETLRGGETDDDGTVYFDFTLNVGRYVSEITAQTDEPQDGYCIRVHAQCDEKNKTFYSEDGILYHRSTGEPVAGFQYW